MGAQHHHCREQNGENPGQYHLMWWKEQHLNSTVDWSEGHNRDLQKGQT